MIIIHKKESSQNKKSLKFLANEQLTKMGWSELKFPDQSQENAKDALPGDIWGYVLRSVQDENKVYVSFIKKDHQERPPSLHCTRRKNCLFCKPWKRMIVI